MTVKLGKSRVPTVQTKANFAEYTKGKRFCNRYF